MIEIPLPCGKVTLVSDEDWPRVRPLSWYDRGGGYVAARYKKSLGGHGRLVPMHRFILAAPAGYVVDHIDGNPLNNQRDNLQITTNSRNLMRSVRAKSGGIQRAKTGWDVRLRVDGRSVYFGTFSTEEEAREMRDEARRLIWSDRFNELSTKL